MKRKTRAVHEYFKRFRNSGVDNKVSDNGFGKMSGTFIIMENVYKKCAWVILMKRKLVV